jgi:hypothetical protein
MSVRSPRGPPGGVEDHKPARAGFHAPAFASVSPAHYDQPGHPGRCQVNGGEVADITGAVKDASIQFSFTVSGYTLNYSGKVDGETVSGAIEVAGATGTFAGTRAKA